MLFFNSHHKNQAEKAWKSDAFFLGCREDHNIPYVVSSVRMKNGSGTKVHSTCICGFQRLESRKESELERRNIYKNVIKNTTSNVRKLEQGVKRGKNS